MKPTLKKKRSEGRRREHRLVSRLKVENSGKVGAITSRYKTKEVFVVDIGFRLHQKQPSVSVVGGSAPEKKIKKIVHTDSIPKRWNH